MEPASRRPGFTPPQTPLTRRLLVYFASGAYNQKDLNGTNNPPHAAAGFPATCDTCHNTASWAGATFNHNTATKFPLTGAHINLTCNQCHAGGKFAGTSTDCASCHLTDFNKTTNPNHASAGFPTLCSACHTTSSWAGAQFDHSKTPFPLTGAHMSVACAQCHVNNQFASLSTACAGCHLKDFQGTTNPSHASAGFPTTCDTCHTTTNWLGATFNHTATGFALTGFHASLQCAQCHVNGNFSLTSGTCINCHAADFTNTTNPPHKSAGFPQDCTLCHTTTNWTGATFNHTGTGFALTGFHTTLQCAQCHVNNNFSLTSGACIGCHLTDFNNTNSPPHQSAGFPTTCATCHTTTNWQGATFNHTTTGFALTGFHTTLQCAQCHVNNNFSLTSGACIGCHLADFNSTTSPPHKSSGFPQDCTMCHTTTNWTSATFNHATTGFPVTGFHTTLQCAQCHINNNFSLNSPACINCHQNDYNGTNNPPHQSAGFPTTCDTCHNTTNWLGATFNHTTTGFALTGFHTTLQCSQCHINNNFSLSSGACIGCHLADYNGANNPPHQAGGFPQDCTLCHSTTNWTSATFNHATTGFPLMGFHTTLQCAQCHINNNYSLNSPACINCHEADYQGTNNPPHQAGGFPTTCDTCHTTTNWLGATFNHTTTGFALTGFHTTLQCSQCHVNNNFSLNSGACIGCHLTDYNNTNNPPHQSAGFPQDCTLCHTTTDWTGATFNHATTGFALTGFHATMQCAQCHINNNYSLSSAACINCHQNDYNGTTNPAHAAAGFPTTCDTCHNTTSWAGATFDHSKTGWALTGIHATTACSSCHIGGNYSLTSTACYGCHQADYQGTNNPNHVAAGFPTTCDTCHTTAGWTGATFNHTWFPVPHHSAKLCTDCHNNSSNYAVFVCTVCHTQTHTDPEHQGVNGYVWNSTNCYACHPNGGGG